MKYRKNFLIRIAILKKMVMTVKEDLSVFLEHATQVLILLILIFALI